MLQVIIVSNRLPISVKKDDGKLVFSSSLGGLATGLSSYVGNRKNSLWVGWPGIASDELNNDDKEEITNELGKQGYVPVFLSQKQIDNFYNGFSNSILWPLFHDLPIKSQEPELVNEWWQTYQSVNKRFAESVLHLVSPKSQIWVHDYQLMLMPAQLKSNHNNINVGFFLHIPFPAPKQFDNLEQSKTILRNLLAADLIGLHTSSYVQNLLMTTRYLGIGSTGNNQVTINKHIARVSDFPMGIDYEKYAEAGNLKDVKKLVKAYKKKYKRLKIIVSVDRLDPSKGLVERLKAFSEFLSSNPQLHSKVVFVMVAAPSRTSIEEYSQLSKTLDKLAKEINKKFGTNKWQPLDYINEPVPFEDVTALFQIADVAFIAPKRDGMNLAAKEFVASNKKEGVLILSETAGAAEELNDAIIVDPSDRDSLVKALEQSLTMRKRELRRRLKRMKRYLSTNTVQSWAKTFIDSLQQPIPGTPHITRSLNKRLSKLLVKDYLSARKRLLLLDYDGTLVPFSTSYDKVKPSEKLIQTLGLLAEDKNNDIVLISGRDQSELEDWFSNLPISLVSEHGAAIKKNGGKWHSIEKAEPSWKKLLLPVLQKYADLTPGAKVEVKPHSLVWHYRAASNYYAQKYSVIIKRSLKPILKKEGLELLQGNKVLEIKNPKVSKGVAAKNWLNNDYDFIMAIGDDNTDEELFSELPLSTYSIKVGRGLSLAKYRLHSYKDVTELLRRLSR